MTAAGAAADVLPVRTVITAAGVLGIVALPFVLRQVRLADRPGAGARLPLAGEA